MANYNIWGAYAQGKKLEEDKGVQAQEQSRADALLLLQKTANMDARDYRNKQLNQQEFQSNRTNQLQLKQEDNLNTRFNAGLVANQDEAQLRREFESGENQLNRDNAVRLGNIAHSDSKAMLDMQREQTALLTAEKIKAIQNMEKRSSLLSQVVQEGNQYNSGTLESLVRNLSIDDKTGKVAPYLTMPGTALDQIIPNAITYNQLGNQMAENQKQVKGLVDAANYYKRLLEGGSAKDTQIKKYSFLTNTDLASDPIVSRQILNLQQQAQVVLNAGPLTGATSRDKAILNGFLRIARANIQQPMAPVQQQP